MHCQMLSPPFVASYGASCCLQKVFAPWYHFHAYEQDHALLSASSADRICQCHAIELHRQGLALKLQPAGWSRASRLGLRAQVHGARVQGAAGSAGTCGGGGQRLERGPHRAGVPGRRRLRPGEPAHAMHALPRRRDEAAGQGARGREVGWETETV
jgi:hypothetical protein